MTNYQINKIAKMIKNGDATIIGTTRANSLGESNYIINDHADQCVWHVPTDMRPSWTKKIVKEEN